MIRVAVFAEDSIHEAFVTALLKRISSEYIVPFRLSRRSSLRGGSRFVAELRRYLRDVGKKIEPTPNFLVVATDANCKGARVRKKEILEAIPDSFRDLIVPAIPEPHAERWMLLDPSAFKQVFGKGCRAPDKKCERSRYKGTLYNEIAETGCSPALGGWEFAEDIVRAMDLDEIRDGSLRSLVADLRSRFRSYSQHR